MKNTGLRQSFAKGTKRHKAAMHLIPNLFTTGNLFCGIFAVLSVFNADYMAAAIAIRMAWRSRPIVRRQLPSSSP